MLRILSILFFLGVFGFTSSAQVKEMKTEAPAEDSITLQKPIARFFSPKKAAMLSAAFPGAGQIYNRKYWKVPLIYGGFVAFAMSIDWNHKYYTLYKNAYSDWVDTDPSTVRWQKVWAEVDEGSEDWFQSTLETKKDRYRRDRDFLIILTGGLYVLNIIDANIDAHLSDFDISEDLSLKIEPAIQFSAPQETATMGLRLRLKF